MRLGVTGHQSLVERLHDQGSTSSEAEAWEWIDHKFSALLAETSGGQVIVVSSLAVGTDQRLSRMALESGAAIEVIIPSLNYERTFAAEESLTEYRGLLSRAAYVRCLEYPEPTEAAFLAAGYQVVDLTDMVIAVWDGKKAEGVGGTADVVAYAKRSGRAVIHLNPVRQTVQW